MLAPSGVPREIVARLNGELVKATQSKDLRERLGTMGIQPLASTPEQFGEFLKSEVVKWGKAVRESGARVE